MARFQIATQGYDFTIVHRAGKENRLADYLSRYPPNQASRKRKSKKIAAIELQAKITMAVIQEAQQKSKFAMEAMKVLRRKERDENFTLPTKFLHMKIWRDALCAL